MRLSARGVRYLDLRVGRGRAGHEAGDAAGRGRCSRPGDGARETLRVMRWVGKLGEQAERVSQDGAFGEKKKTPLPRPGTPTTGPGWVLAPQGRQIRVGPRAFRERARPA